jgi:hypothetical protein
VQGGFFEEGQKLWVHDADGSARAAVFVGDSEGARFLGGPPLAYVLFVDTREPAQVELDRLTVRD